MSKVLSLDKSLSVLEAVFQARDGVGTRALQHKLGYNVATVHNIAITFCSRGYLRQDPVTRLFFPGLRLMHLGRHPGYLHLLTNISASVVNDVAARLNESVLLASIQNGRVLNLKYVPSKQALRVQEAEDVTDHAYCTACGKVLLSALSDADLKGYLKEVPLKRFTPRTLTTEEDLRSELQKVRMHGFAKTCDEACDGISAVAVPIHDAWGGIIASLGASAPTVRMCKPNQVENSLGVLREGAVAIEKIWNDNVNKDSARISRHELHCK